MIAYKKTNGRATDLRCVRDDYVPAEGEFTLPGWDLPDLATLSDPVPIAELRAAAWERIKAERDRRLQAGGYLAGGKWFHSDSFSRSQQLGLRMMGESMPGGIQWKTMDGSFIEMTPTLAGQVFAAAAASDIAIFTAAEAHKAAMEAAEDPAAYDFTAGWPAAFGE